MDKFETFERLFCEYNLHTNLMSKNDVQKIREKHIPDSLAIELFLEKYGHDVKNIIDVGTGGGFPSVPTAIKYENLNVTALDSIAKKIKFVELVKNELNLENLFPVCSRIEDFEKREFYDAAVSRAVAPLSSVLEYCTPFVKQNGYVVAYKAATADEELLQAQKAIGILKLKFVEKIEYCLSEKDGTHCLLVFEKLSPTSKKYPRQNNLVRKNPL
ncbi:MAG: 16S rRNA (guanine(527)-N(7))-methyltransferase RsmG [Candidatus Gastranaerophilales bacterium]|nr:16S rRNA (guanine(527)-N(7))-methyltransferase RsmG [Candidatus Gastranaerophilales bacterium]